MPTINQLVRKGRAKDTEKSGNARIGQFSTAERRLCQGLYNNTEKTKFGFEKSR